MEYEHSSRICNQVEVCGGEFNATQYEMRRPFYLCRAKVEKFGQHSIATTACWRAVYGHVEGFGKTPAAAAIAFDLVWLNGSIEKAAEAQSKEQNTRSLPWPEKVAMLSINPDPASSADVAQLASELMNCHQQDSVKTNEINVLVKENKELRAALREVLNRAIPHNSDFLVTRYAINKVCAVLGTKAPTGIGHHGGVE